MLSIEVGSIFPVSWIYVDRRNKSDDFGPVAALKGEQWDTAGKAEDDPISCGEVTLYVSKDCDEEGIQDLLVLILDDDRELAFSDGEANVVLMVDDELKIMTKVLSEIMPSKPVFPMSRQLIALLTVAKKLVFVYSMSDGGQRFAVFNAPAPLEWELEPSHET